MKTFEIVYMDGYDEVRDLETGETIFKTNGIDPKIIDEVVILWNKTSSPYDKRLRKPTDSSVG